MDKKLEYVTINVAMMSNYFNKKFLLYLLIPLILLINFFVFLEKSEEGIIVDKENSHVYSRKSKKRITHGIYREETNRYYTVTYYFENINKNEDEIFKDKLIESIDSSLQPFIDELNSEDVEKFHANKNKFIENIIENIMLETLTDIFNSEEEAKFHFKMLKKSNLKSFQRIYLVDEKNSFIKGDVFRFTEKNDDTIVVEHFNLYLDIILEVLMFIILITIYFNQNKTVKFLEHSICSKTETLVSTIHLLLWVYYIFRIIFVYSRYF